jgi:hypothetical protein
MARAWTDLAARIEKLGQAPNLAARPVVEPPPPPGPEQPNQA